MTKPDSQTRSAARLAAVQALYQMETAGAGVESTIAEYAEHRLGREIEGLRFHEADAGFFAELLRGAVEMQAKIDPFIERQLAANWTLSRLDAIARAIVRAGLYELTRRPDIPFRVVIDEYVEIANDFFDGDEPRFINAVLDAAARETRKDEF
ncbi:MAG: transcription antitermination factor NusB [Parvularculaceae bacterium]